MSPIAVPKGRPPFAKRQVKRFVNFSGGLNNAFSPALVKDDEVADIQNYNYDEKGTLKKRNGFVKRYAALIASAPIKGLYNLRKDDGSSLLVIACNGELWKDKPNFGQTYDSQAEWQTSGVVHQGTTTSETAGDVKPVVGTKSALGFLSLGAPGSASLGGTRVHREKIWRSNTLDISSVQDKTTGVVVKGVTLPTGTSLAVETRVSDDEVTWEAWTALGAGDSIQGVGAKTKLQLRARTNSTSGRRASAQSIVVRFDTTGTPTSIGSGYSTTARWRFETQNDQMLGFNGENAPVKWDGVAAAVSALGGSPPQGKYVILHKNRLFVTGVPGAPSRVYYSDLGDPESWPALNFIDVGKGDGDVNTGFGITLDSLTITKTNSVWNLSGDSSSNFVLRKSSNDGGSVGMSSMAPHRTTLVWFGKDGVRVYDGLRSVLSSEKIAATLDDLNDRQLALAAGVFFDDKYYLAVPEGDAQLSNNAVLVFDTLRTAWTVYRGMAASEWCVFKQFNKDTLLFGSATTGQVHEISESNYNDDGVAITAYVVTKAVAPAGGEEAQAILRNSYVSAAEPEDRATEAVVSFFKDLGDESDPTTIELAAVPLNVKRVIPAAVDASLVRTVAVKVQHSELDRGLNIHSIALEYTPRPGLRATF